MIGAAPEGLTKRRSGFGPDAREDIVGSPSVWMRSWGGGLLGSSEPKTRSDDGPRKRERGQECNYIGPPAQV
jgi:hypothetical protein